MNREEFVDFFVQKAAENGILISYDVAVEFYLYMKNLIEWNEMINLTAIRNEREIVIKHFVDSIFVSKFINGKKMLDLGSGAGFPGLPLKILDKSLNVSLIDSVNKKVNFMRDTVEKLNLNNIEVLHVRAEDLGHEEKYREKFDTVVSRAVANMSTLVEYMLPFLKVGGKCLCLKGPNCEEEINLAKIAVRMLGGRIENVIEYKVEDNDRCLIIITKEKNTEQIYPRKSGKPLKEPLQ